MLKVDSAAIADFVARTVVAWKQVHKYAAAESETKTLTDDALVIDGCRFSNTLPRLSTSAFVSWLGHRVVLWPDGIEYRKRLAIVSSRIGKRKDLFGWWFDALRTAILRSNSKTECLCLVNETAAADAVARGSELFGLPRLRLEVSSGCFLSVSDLTDWMIDRITTLNSEDTYESFETRAILSPEIQLAFGDKNQTKLNSPARDSMLVLSGERIISLSCRSGGHVEECLQRRLAEKSGDSCVVLVNSSDEAPPVSDSLIDNGAVPWFLQYVDANPPTVEGDSKEALPKRLLTIPDGPLENPGQWLLHWTRPSPGPWVDQPSDDFLDELILGCESADRSALAALMRMIAQQRIVATLATVGEPDTVSFTAVPLAEFRSRRVFRRHRQRFDFEPWGIGIRTDVVRRLGGEPVHYLTPEQSVNEVDATFTQMRYSGRRKVDWSQEKEWRVPGDVILNEIPVNDVCVFVNREMDAVSIRPSCSWPVVALPD